MRRILVLTIVAGLVSAAAAQAVQDRPVARPGGSNAGTLRILNQTLTEVRFVEQPFDSVIEWLGEFTGMNIVVRWQTLEDAGVRRDTPVSMQVKNLRLSQVLWLLMNEVAGSELRLAYRASGNLLIVSTADDLGREVVTKVYDVSDMLLRPPNAVRPDFTQNNQGLQSTSGGGGGGQSVFGTSNTNQTQQDEDQGNDVQIQKLIDIIQSTVEPDTWVRNGGNLGHIDTFGNLLIIRNTILVHQQIGGYLREQSIVGP